MNKILFTFILSMYFTNVSSFHHSINARKNMMIHSKNNNEIDLFNSEKDFFNIANINFLVDDNLLQISERKHGQIAIVSLFSILMSEILISNSLLEGKGINLVESFNNLNYIPLILILYSIYEISFKGLFPILNFNKNFINTEIFFGRLSMILITFTFLYETNYDNPVISQDLKTILSAILLYFRILFSLN